MARRPVAKRGATGEGREDSEDLLDTLEDILEEVQQIREDIRPLIWLAWIYLFALAVAVIVGIGIVVAGAVQSGTMR